MKRIFTALLIAATTTTAMAQNQDYEVESFLEIYDLKTSTHKVVKSFPFRIEAPNWTPDGKWLVFNSMGRLYKLPADGSGEAVEIETGSARQCNNDHVVSSDGRFLAISNAPEGNWISHVYVLPFEGGEPTLVTEKGPSYLHGWSPDMKWFAYCAFRDEEKGADIYVKPADGGEEVQLTDTPGLDDGPEYSPNGKHIWFNSVRSGLMQVWRMNADGSMQRQMTFEDDLNAWFPHVSPNGKKVIYIAYHKGDLLPGEHLPNKNVVIKMIPAKGGKPQTLVELFGGQGSLNVNSWAPDSKRFAYVSYRLK